MAMRTQRQHSVCFTLDVLTDGSEYTGHGTIFLSVWKKPKHLHNHNNSNNEWLLESMNTYAPISRYAIAGIGDLTARLSADQRFKLSSTRGVFSPSSDSLDGLSALLLALYSAGAPSLHLVSTKSDIMEELANIVLGSRRNLQISNCQVPGTPSSEHTLHPKTFDWWLVYQDDYLIVHASRRDARDWDQVTYLFTMCSSGEQSSTIAVLPPRCHCHRQAYKELLQAELPILPDDNNTHIKVHAILALNVAKDDLVWLEGEKNLKIPLMVTSQDLVGSVADPGILIRSQQVIQCLSEQLPQKFPKVTPLSKILPMVAWEKNILRLRSCTSIIFDLATPHARTVLDRRPTIWDRSLSDEFQSTIDSLQNFPIPSMALANQDVDQNEIDLDLDNNDDDNDDSNDEGPVLSPHSPLCAVGPKLYVLGTGCATPSAIRGASGYALSFPTNDPSNNGTSMTLILDCGEGLTTMLSRYGPDNWRQSIQGIWISHAHLDHYGGLPTLIRTIVQHQDQHEPSHHVVAISDHHDLAPTLKRQKGVHTTACCWVMAPPKVLRYLDLCLGCHHGRRKNDGRQLFDPRLPHDPTIPRGPWTNFQNIRVLHSCPAYGLLLGWNSQSRTRTPCIDGSQDKVWFCFSGDTRPSDALIRTCRQATAISGGSRRNNVPVVLFLLHEATFEDTEQGQADQKKHSTIGEAVQVANQIGATQVLLTHFSQRYVSIQNVTSPKPHSTHVKIPVGLAMDGLCLSLE